MATLTAQILVGSKHPYHDGINPSHYLFLSENSRPAWILVPENIFTNADHQFNRHSRMTWIPTIENMLEDALLMISLYVLKAPEVCNLAKNYLKNEKENWVELYDDVTPENLKRMYEASRSIKADYKIILSVFEGSSIWRQIAILDHYRMDMEVCMSSYSRSCSVWDGRTVSKGSLGELSNINNLEGGDEDGK